jgi:transcriptional regulator with PAS, ATPase and Fis domain
VQFDGNHLRVLQAIAHISALALENLNQLEKLQQENLSLRAEIGLKHDIVGGGPQIRKVFDFIRKVAPADSTVLIQGESGTGKELVARAIHSNSSRADHPFIAINSAAIAASLLESELFGHEKGAFTGAVAQKKGKVELAEGGSLFLDEISELAPELQAKLLRVLQEREFERVGGTRSIPLNIRLIAATNKSLAQAVESGQFRKDLFYRLNVVAVTLPPLRDRREDIPEMAEYFLRKARSKCQTLAKSISPEAMDCLKQYDWPGNVRELENAIERAAVLGTNDLVRPDDLPESIVEGGNVPGESANYYNALKDFKKQLIQQALQQANGSYLEAAKTLGLHPNSLLRLMRNLNIKSASKGLSSTGGA